MNKLLEAVKHVLESEMPGREYELLEEAYKEAKAEHEESPLPQLKRIADALEELVSMYRVVR